MEFHDFQIRAWNVDHTSASVLVHCSPAGAMQRPEVVALDWDQLTDFKKMFQSDAKVSPDRLISGGKELAALILPDHVLGLLIKSLERINREDGLRVRLCLDNILSDLPWEYLILRDVALPKSPGGFLALDSRISLIRQPPQPRRQRLASTRKQRLLYFGTRCCSEEGIDLWKTVKEKNVLFHSLEPLNSLLEKESIFSNEKNCRAALMESTGSLDFFHYTGHTDDSNGKGYLLASDTNRNLHSTERLYADILGPLLRRMGTTVAVFSACNSGNWTFVEPLLNAEVPVVVGVQGLIYVKVANAFCRQLYSALAIGLTLDEAVTWARLHLLEPGVLPDDLKWQWGSFMIYMQSPDGVLFPRPLAPEVVQQQEAARIARKQTVINVTMHIGSIHDSTVTGVSAQNISSQICSENSDSGAEEVKE
jgi:hypothetical protein